MTFEEAQIEFLKKHIPGKRDVYIWRPNPGGMCAGVKEFFPGDFEVRNYEEQNLLRSQIHYLSL